MVIRLKTNLHDTKENREALTKIIAFARKQFDINLEFSQYGGLTNPELITFNNIIRNKVLEEQT